MEGGELEQDLGELLTEVGALAAEADSGVLLLLDEDDRRGAISDRFHPGRV